MGAWHITVKDLRLILKDRGALYTLLALPVVFIAILGASTGQLMASRDELKLIKLAVVDQDDSDISRQVYESLESIGGLKVEKVRDTDEAKQRLKDGRDGIAIIFGKDFHNRIEDLEMADVLDAGHGKLMQGLSVLDIQVECGSTYVGIKDMLEYVMMAAVMQVVAPEVTSRNPIFARVVERMIERHREAEKDHPSPAKLVQTGPSIVYQTLVPSFLVLFAFFLVNIMASSFIHERKLGTLRRIQSTRTTPFQLLCGKTLPFFLVSVVQSLLLFASGKLMFGMSWGTYPFLILPVVATTSLSATGLGLLIATFVRSESQVASYSTFLIVVLAGISGCYMPRDWLPQFMQTISLGTPHAWALVAYQELLTTAHPNLQIVAKCCGILTAMGAVFFGLGCVRFRKIEYST